MNRKIEIAFIEDAAVEIRAVKTAISATCGPEQRAARRHFWLGWQLFGAE